MTTPPPTPDPWLIAMIAATFLVAVSMIYVFYGEKGVRSFVSTLKDILWIVVIIAWLAYGYYTPPMPMPTG